MAQLRRQCSLNILSLLYSYEKSKMKRMTEKKTIPRRVGWEAFDSTDAVREDDIAGRMLVRVVQKITEDANCTF